MLGFPSPGGPWPAIRRDLERPNRRPVVAVIAYIGKDAPTVMPLRRGDILVCDASDPAVKSRLTSVDALKDFRRRGVQLFSLEGLHAKVVASPTAAWVGSSNASTNSAAHLIEAAVKVTQQQARDVHGWASSLATEDCFLGPADLKRLEALKLEPPRGGPRRSDPPRELPERVRRLVFWKLDGQISKRQEAAIERDRPAAKRDARVAGLPSSLEPVPFIGDTVVKTGDWLITRRSGRVQAPGFVVRIMRVGSGGTVWLSRVPVPRRPPVSALRSLVPRLAADPEELEVPQAAVTAAVLDTFR